MTETHEARLGRLRTRSMWRGIPEMDLILRGCSSRYLPPMTAPDLDLYEALLAESAHDILAWITRAAPPPDRFAPICPPSSPSSANSFPALRPRTPQGMVPTSDCKRRPSGSKGMPTS